jgi:hypothetical protein
VTRLYSRQSKNNFSIPDKVNSIQKFYRSALGPTEFPTQSVPGALSSGVTGQERGADHSLSSSIEDKN